MIGLGFRNLGLYGRMGAGASESLACYGSMGLQ